MKGNKVVLIAIIVIVAIIIIIVYVYRKTLFGANVSSPITSPGIPSSGGSGFIARSDNFPLKKGSSGARVLAAQKVFNGMIAHLGLPKLVEDGDFGPKTEAATMAALNGKKQISEVDYNTYIVPFVAKETVAGPKWW